MSSNRFFTTLIFITAGSLMLIFLTNFVTGLSPQILLISYFSVLFFTVFCIVFYLWGKKVADSNNPYTFNNVIVFSTLSKMILCLGLLLIFKKTFQPESKFVIVPFLFFYILYTIFETYFLTILGKAKNS